MRQHNGSRKSERNGPAWWETQDRLREEGGLLLVVGIQHDGANYQLDPSAEQKLEGVTPNAPRPRSVFLGHDGADDFEVIHPPHWPRIVEMLTGLTLDQLEPFAPIRLFAQDLNRVVWELMPKAVGATR